MRPGRAADHSPPSRAAVMEEYSYNSTHPLGHAGTVTGTHYFYLTRYCVVDIIKGEIFISRTCIVKGKLFRSSTAGSSPQFTENTQYASSVHTNHINLRRSSRELSYVFAGLEEKSEFVGKF